MDLLSISFISLFIISLIISKMLNKSYDKALTPIVFILILTISSWASSSIRSTLELMNLLIMSIFYALITIFCTYLIGIFISRTSTSLSIAKAQFKPTFIIAITIGWIAGFFIPGDLPFRDAISIELLILAIAAGISVGNYFSIDLLKKSAKTTILTIITAILGSIIAGIITSLLFSIDVETSLAICLGMGWYTYTGPIIAASKGYFLGTLAFLANFLREQFTFILVPFLKGSPHSLISIGGATAMDDTLPIYIARLGKEYSISSISSGLILTLLVPFFILLALYF